MDKRSNPVNPFFPNLTHSPHSSSSVLLFSFVLPSARVRESEGRDRDEKLREIQGDWGTDREDLRERNRERETEIEQERKGSLREWVREREWCCQWGVRTGEEEKPRDRATQLNPIHPNPDGSGRGETERECRGRSGRSGILRRSYVADPPVSNFGEFSDSPGMDFRRKQWRFSVVLELYFIR
jgi:hypothetical protein